MKKKDLHENLIVQVANGGYYRICGKRMVGENGWLSLDSYKEDLTLSRRECADYDIQAVFEPLYWSFSELGEVKDVLEINKLLWKRHGHLTMSVSEVEEKLGMEPGSLIIEKDETC